MRNCYSVSILRFEPICLPKQNSHCVELEAHFHLKTLFLFSHFQLKTPFFLYILKKFNKNKKNTQIPTQSKNNYKTMLYIYGKINLFYYHKIGFYKLRMAVQVDGRWWCKLGWRWCGLELLVASCRLSHSYKIIHIHTVRQNSRIRYVWFEIKTSIMC